MTTVTSDRTIAAAAAYVDAVANALDRAGVTDPERQDLLDDLTGHLAELEAEDVAQLGPPATYAAELLISAGIVVDDDDVTPPATESLWRRARADVRAAFDSQLARSVRRFLPELRPGWWVARGWAIVALVVVMNGGSGDRAVKTFPLPKAFDDVLPSYLLLAAVIVASVAIGRRGGRRWLDWGVTAVGVLGAVVALNVDVPDTTYSYSDMPPAMLIGPDGRVIYNIWPYDAQGRPLDDVLLYDQDGMPIDLGDTGYYDPYAFPGLYPRGADQGEPRPYVELPRLPGATTTVTEPTTTTTTTPATLESTTVFPLDSGG